MLCPSCGRDNPPEATFCMACAAKLDLPADGASSHDLATSADFVGRQREMRELVSALDDALAGKGRLVMLVGEPGIGKTRTAEELASYAMQQDTRVLWGRCHEQQGMPPYWPWVQIIRTYVRDCDSDQMRSEMGAGAGDIAELVPDAKERLPDIQPPPPLESPEQARFRLFDSITTWLKNASQMRPLVLILDNLHWADKPSLLLLEFLGQELGDSHLLIIGTYRDVDLTRQHPLSETLGELSRARLFQRIALRGLSLEDEGRYIEAASGVEPPKEFVEMLHSHTEGNPLFVAEVVRMLQQEGELTPEHIANLQSHNVRIPEGVREVIGRRLNGLSEDCNRVLTVASVIGREFGFSQLPSLVEGISEDTLLDVLDEALNVHVIEELPERAGGYQFSHALIQQTISEELSLTRRTRLHARIAESLEELYGAESEAHASELAHHFAQAETVLGTEKLVKYSIMAGERAIASYAYEEALIHFQRALTAREGSPSSTDMGQSVDAETATILFGLGRAQMATSARAQEAIDTLRRAFDAFVDLRDTENAVAVVTHPHGFLGYSTGTADMAARALDLVPPGSLEAGYLLSRYGAAQALENREYEGAQENLDRAVEIARREGDRVLEVRALVYIAQIHWVQGHYRETIDKSLPVIELAQSLDELGTLVRARAWCAHALLTMGDGNEAQIHATAGLEVAERLHSRFWLFTVLIINTNLAILKGEWKVAQEFNARAIAESPRHSIALSDGAILNLHLGNLEESSEYIKQIQEVVPDVLVGLGVEHPYVAATLPLFTRVKGTTELLDVAESVARAILSSSSRRIAGIRLTRVGLALIAIQRSDAGSAKEQYSILESQRGTQEEAFICYDRLLGLLAQTMGNHDNACTHFEDALAFCRKAGYRTELAWTLYDCAALQQAQREPEKALALLEEALSISTELGMRPLMEKATVLKEQVEAQPTKAPQYPDGLTQREVEVLRLIAAGKTDREIGDDLFISIRTVGNHVSNILSKTGCANRTEAASYAHEHNLV